MTPFLKKLAINIATGILQKKKDYSSVGIICKSEPKHVEYGTGIDYMDREGRNIRADFEDVSVMSLYLPSGTNDDRLSYKFTYMDDFKNLY